MRPLSFRSFGAIVAMSSVAVAWTWPWERRFEKLFDVELDKAVSAYLLDSDRGTDDFVRIHPKSSNPSLDEYSVSLSAKRKVAWMVCGTSKDDTQTKYNILRTALVEKYGKPDSETAGGNLVESRWIEKQEYPTPEQKNPSGRVLKVARFATKWVEVCLTDDSIEHLDWHSPGVSTSDGQRGL